MGQSHGGPREEKKGDIRISLDLWKLNNAFFHDPFPMSFTDEVLNNVGRH